MEEPLIIALEGTLRASATGGLIPTALIFDL
jgi:hypothetical protein